LFASFALLAVVMSFIIDRMNNIVLL